MPATSERQRKEAGIEVSRRREGKKPKRFKSMTRSELRDFAKKKK